MSEQHKYLRFRVRGGRVMVDGKSHYPSVLRVQVSRADALDAIELLVQQLRSCSPDDGFELWWSGEFEEGRDDD